MFNAQTIFAIYIAIHNHFFAIVPLQSTKCKGVMGAAMAIKHLAGKTESCKIAEDLVCKSTQT